jgi:nucleoside 2-deoxyribosyltransferase
LDSLKKLPSPTVSERAMKLFERFVKLGNAPGFPIDIFDDYRSELHRELRSSFRKDDWLGLLPPLAWEGVVDSQFLAWSWSEHFSELQYLLQEVLIEQLGALSVIGNGHFVITPKGWSQFESLRAQRSSGRIGFIAMWFSHEVDPCHVAIDSGIRLAGYEALRIDRKEHNNKIDDEIVAGIKRSKFLVADFTGHRGGVYFEAGLATGLGLPVVWLCRKDELEKIHFDTRQYNFILWESDKLDELTKALKNRIEATIGRGPLATSA